MVSKFLVKLKQCIFISVVSLLVLQKTTRATLLVQKQPKHIHLALGDEPGEMIVTWSTIDRTNDSIVEYALHGQPVNTYRVYGTAKILVEDSSWFSLKNEQYVHHAVIRGLLPNTFYTYHCGSDEGWSELFFFKTMKEGEDWSPRFAIYGDMGNENAQSLTRLQQEVQIGMYDAILHVGDFAYDMDTDNGRVGDKFMEQIQPIAAYLPYMTCPGNHENARNFTQYKTRFNMPGGYESMMYSFNVGPIHFISFSTEFYYFLEYGIKPVIKQYQWLENDLKEANRPENREKRPWIITYGHRPMYCSNNNTDDCTKHETLVRVGIPYLHWFGLEDLFTRYGVDLAIWAHEHSYERMFPMYNHKVYNGSVEDPYRNPKAMVHVTTGSAGCKERHDDFIDHIPEWTAFRSTDYGYSRMQVINKTHLYWEQVSEDKDGEIIDAFHIIRDKHTSYKLFDESDTADTEYSPWFTNEL